MFVKVFLAIDFDLDKGSKQPNKPVPALEGCETLVSVPSVKSLVPPNKEAVDPFFSEERFVPSCLAMLSHSF